MFKFLIILVVLIFVFGKLFRLLFKYAIIGAMHKNAYQSEPQRKKEGSIHINNEPGKTNGKNSPRSGGEYIDYEVIK